MWLTINLWPLVANFSKPCATRNPYQRTIFRDYQTSPQRIHTANCGSNICTEHLICHKKGSQWDSVIRRRGFANGFFWTPLFIVHPTGGLKRELSVEQMSLV